MSDGMAIEVRMTGREGMPGLLIPAWCTQQSSIARIEACACECYLIDREEFDFSRNITPLLAGKLRKAWCWARFRTMYVVM